MTTELGWVSAGLEVITLINVIMLIKVIIVMVIRPPGGHHARLLLAVQQRLVEEIHVRQTVVVHVEKAGKRDLENEQKKKVTEEYNKSKKNPAYGRH